MVQVVIGIFYFQVFLVAVVKNVRLHENSDRHQVLLFLKVVVGVFGNQHTKD